MEDTIQSIARSEEVEVTDPDYTNKGNKDEKKMLSSVNISKLHFTTIEMS